MGAPTEKQPQAMHNRGLTCIEAQLVGLGHSSQQAGNLTASQAWWSPPIPSTCSSPHGPQSVEDVFQHELYDCTFPPTSPRWVQTCIRVLTAVAGMQCTPAHSRARHTPDCMQPHSWLPRSAARSSCLPRHHPLARAPPRAVPQLVPYQVAQHLEGQPLPQHQQQH